MAGVVRDLKRAVYPKRAMYPKRGERYLPAALLAGRTGGRRAGGIKLPPALGLSDMKKRKGRIKKPKASAAAKKKKRPTRQAEAKRGRKTEIESMESPALVQLLIQAAMQDGTKPGAKTKRLVGRAARQILARLGLSRKEAGELTDMIMEQLQ